MSSPGLPLWVSSREPTDRILLCGFCSLNRPGSYRTQPSSTASPSSPSSTRFYRTRIASSSTVASQETLSTLSASPGSGSALAQLRSRLDLDQAAREQATAASSGPHPAKLRKRSHRPLSAEEAARLAEAAHDHDEGVPDTSQSVLDHAPELDHDPPEWALEPAVPESDVPEPGGPELAGVEAIPAVSMQLPESATPIAEPQLPEPEPSPSFSSSPPSSVAFSVVFAPVRLGWRVATAPARLSYRAASMGVGAVESGIAFGHAVAEVGIATAVVDASANVPLVGGVVSLVSERVGWVTARTDKGTRVACSGREGSLLRLRETVAPARIVMAALQVSIGVALAAALVAKAVLDLALHTLRGQPSSRL